MTQRVRGRHIGFIPQDPFLALNPVFRIGTQLLGALRWHAPPAAVRTERARHARPSRRRCCAACRSPIPRRRSSAIRTSSPAASASAC